MLVVRRSNAQRSKAGPCWQFNLLLLLRSSFAIEGKSHFNVALVFFRTEHVDMCMLSMKNRLTYLILEWAWCGALLLDHSPCRSNGAMTKKPSKKLSLFSDKGRSHRWDIKGGRIGTRMYFMLPLVTLGVIAKLKRCLACSSLTLSAWRACFCLADPAWSHRTLVVIKLTKTLGFVEYRARDGPTEIFLHKDLETQVWCCICMCLK